MKQSGLILFTGLYLSIICICPAQEQNARITVKILDAKSGQAVPARLELIDSMGKSFLAENALLLGGDQENRDLPWQGSIEEAGAWFKANHKKFARHMWARGEQFYCDGTAEFLLPVGQYKLRAFRGMEYLDADQSFTIDTLKEKTITLKLERWIYMAREGWYSADAHLHIPRFVPELDPYLSKCMQAEDINFANLLRWGHSRHFNNAPQHTPGKPGVYQEGNYFLLSGQENPRTHFLGHTIILGAFPAIHQDDRYLVYRHFFERAFKQGALSGFAHKGKNFIAQNGLGINLPDGFLNFIEVLQFREGSYEVWYDTLNSGFRIAPLAGTDYPWGKGFPGRERFYTPIKGKPTADAWIDNIRKGQVFVTMGPMLSFEVNGKSMGETVALNQPGSVRIKGRVRINPESDILNAVELIHCGQVLKTFHPGKGQDEFTFDIEQEVHDASWFALRTNGQKKGLESASQAHTAAVYVEIKGQPDLAHHPRAKVMADKWIKILKELESILLDDKKSKKLVGGGKAGGVSEMVLEKNSADLLKATQDAIGFYQQQKKDISTQ